jgi:immune inhibitor A
MRTILRPVLVLGAIGALTLGAVAPTIAASQAKDRGPTAATPRSDNRAGPLTDRQEARRKAAQELILSGKASANSEGVVQLADDKYFQAAVTGPAKLFTILAEFGNQSVGRYGRVAGPVHDQIPKPNRDIVDGVENTDYDPTLPYDNFRHWKADFTEAHYDDLFFGDGDSFQDFYLEQSSGAYLVTGEVGNQSNDNEGWVTVPGNASTYGDNAIEDFGGAWQFIEDSGNAWYADAVDALGSVEAVDDYLSQFDIWDRYDYNENGNFNEPDGYIDHFQAVHAGEGEEAGGGAQGADAIWSHRWYVNPTDFGATGPTVGDTQIKFGGARIGDSQYWLGDYTVEAENGGLGVFAHEFGHDLGLPDFYDTNAGENGTAFWTLMSSGSWIGDGTEDIGTKPDYMGPWEKLQLGWLDYSVVGQGTSGDFSLDPSAAVIVDVDDQELSTTYVAPNGGHAWWTSSADDLNTTLTRSIDLTGYKSATVTAKAWYDIEAGFDYLFAEYSTDEGANWTAVGAPVDGSSKGHWSNLRYTIPGGAPTLFRFRYQTDGGVHLPGAFIDDITIKSGGTTLFTDDVESGDNGWTAVGGFKRSTGTEAVIGDRYYIAENRTYVGYDAGLEVGPYQFSFGLTDPDKVEHFAFEDGLLVWMVDETYTDNNTSEHAGHGLSLPVDARPTPFKYDTGGQPSNRRQPFDATFGLQDVPAGPTDDPEPGQPDIDCEGLHTQIVVGKGKSQTIGYGCAWPTAEERQAISTFDDSEADAYWDETNPQNSTLVAGVGVQIEVTSQVSGGAIEVSVTNPPPAS